MNTTNPTTDQLEQLSISERAAYNLIASRDCLSAFSIAKEMNITTDQAQKLLNGLVEKGFIAHG